MGIAAQCAAPIVRALAPSPIFVTPGSEPAPRHRHRRPRIDPRPPLDQYRDVMAVDRSWQTPDRNWLIDEIVDEPGVGYRIWHEGEFAGQVAREPTALRDWLAERQIDIGQLLPAADDDPYCE